MTFDKGIFWYSPRVLVYIYGISIWYKESKETFILMAIPSLAHIFLNGFFIDWSAGFCPPGRYLLPFLFTLIPAVSFSVKNIFKRKWFYFLLLIYFAFTFLMFKSLLQESARYGYPSHSGQNYYFEWILSKFNLDTFVLKFRKITFPPNIIWYSPIVLIPFLFTLFVFLLPLNNFKMKKYIKKL